MAAGATAAACWLQHDHARQEGGKHDRRGRSPHPGEEEGGPVQVEDLGQDLRRLSRPWLNRVIERQPRTLLHAVDGVSFSIERGKTLALVGNPAAARARSRACSMGLYHPRGAGSSSTVRTRMRPCLRAAAGRVAVQMIFQDPYASLNPRWMVEAIIGEPLQRARHWSTSSPASRERVGQLLQSVGLIACWIRASTRTSSPAASASASSRAPWPRPPSSWCATSPPRRCT